MDIKDLKNIVTIVQESSFSQASKRLFVSQPALSQSVKRLEVELGVPLFYRDRSRVLPTEAGMLLATKGEPLVLSLEALDLRNKSQGGSSSLGRLSQGCEVGMRADLKVQTRDDGALSYRVLCLTLDYNIVSMNSQFFMVYCIYEKIRPKDVAGGAGPQGYRWTLRYYFKCSSA